MAQNDAAAKKDAETIGKPKPKPKGLSLLLNKTYLKYTYLLPETIQNLHSDQELNENGFNLIVRPFIFNRYSQTIDI